MVEVLNLFQYVGHIQVSHILLCSQAVIACHYHVCTGPSLMALRQGTDKFKLYGRFSLINY